MSNIGENIKKFRLEKGFSRKKLSDRSGVSEISIIKYENGERNPKMDSLYKLAVALGTSLAELLVTADIQYKNSIIEECRDYLGEQKNNYSDSMHKHFDLLNDTGKEKAIEQIELLTKIPEYTN